MCADSDGSAHHGRVQDPLADAGKKRSQRTISNTATLLGSLLMGVAFAVGWSPCIGPILSGILAMASTSESTLRAAMLMTTYSLGLGWAFPSFWRRCSLSGC